MRLTTICNGPKQTIFASGELELLQMVTELDTEWCASEDAEPDIEQCANEDTELDTERCTSEDAGTPRGVDCEIPHQLERETKHSL